MKRRNIMATWSEFNPGAIKSVLDDCTNAAYPDKAKILAYLDSGSVVLAAPEQAVDVFSGEQLHKSEGVLTDGEFSWSNSLSHYVQKYNLHVPKELEDKILSS